MGIFSNLFKKKEVKLPPADLSILHTDIHSHFVPGIDDGSKNMEQTLELLREMISFGYKKVITTPHIMSDYYKNTPEIINAGLADIRKAIKENDLDIEIEAAAEYYLDDDFIVKIQNKNILTFGDNYVLFELPFISEPRMLDAVIFEMQTLGYNPVLAHPERYSYWYDDFEKYIKMVDKGVLLQLNINSLSGAYPKETKAMGERLVAENMVSFLGSDCHNLNHVNMMHNAVTNPSLHALLASGKLKNTSL